MIIWIGSSWEFFEKFVTNIVVVSHYYKIFFWENQEKEQGKLLLKLVVSYAISSHLILNMYL